MTQWRQRKSSSQSRRRGATRCVPAPSAGHVRKWRKAISFVTCSQRVLCWACIQIKTRSLELSALSIIDPLLKEMWQFCKNTFLLPSLATSVLENWFLTSLNYFLNKLNFIRFLIYFVFLFYEEATLQTLRTESSPKVVPASKWREFIYSGQNSLRHLNRASLWRRRCVPNKVSEDCEQ